MPKTKFPILALWAVPRSVSTAFERMMSARGDFTVFNEPFSKGYYFGPDRVNNRYPAEAPSPDHDPHHVLDTLVDAASQGPVFFKDMAYHVHRFMDAKFLDHFQNTLLIRDPRLAIVSLNKKMPDFTREETGYESLLALANIVREQSGAMPHVMDGEILRANPQAVSKQYCEAVGIPFVDEALQWEAGGESHWDNWQEWFDEAAKSKGFKKPAVGFDEAACATPAIAKALEYCTPCYEALRQHIRNK